MIYGSVFMSEDVSGVKDKLDQYGRQFINFLVKEFGIKVVVTSTWRMGETKERLSEAIGIPVYDTTPVLHTIRGREIEAWLAKNEPVEKYLILDDDSDFTVHQKSYHFVKVNHNNGLTFEQMNAIIHYFGISFEEWIKKTSLNNPEN